MVERSRDDDSYEKMILSFRLGNQASLGELYDKYAAALLGIISRILENPDLACDCLQHSFNEIWNQKALYDPKKERIFTWMIRITRNSALNFLKNGHDSFNQDHNPISTEVCSEVKKELMTMVDGETGNSSSTPVAVQSEVLHLVYIKGLTFAEAASRLNIPLQDAKLRFISAIKRLKGKVAV